MNDNWLSDDTGHTEADRVIGRLMSSDPDFDDCQDAALLIRQLVSEIKGPGGYITWKEAAIAERQEANRLRKGLEEYITYLTYQPQGNALHIIDAKRVADRLRELLEEDA